MKTENIGGSVTPGFEAVQKAFSENFVARGELGAACTIYLQGKPVVDLWGGYMDKEKSKPWNENTVVLVYSVTKGMSALATAVAHSKGYICYDALVASIWPEFGKDAGKAKVTVQQLVSEQAGLCSIDLKLDFTKMANLNLLADTLAGQPLNWKPGTHQGNHAYTIGWLHSQLIRISDPAKRTLGKFFKDEIADPLAAEFYIGLPAGFPTDRIARIDGFKGWQMIFHMGTLPWRMVLALLCPWTLSYKTLNNPALSGPADLDVPEHWFMEDGGAGGIGTARALSKIYSEFATGGKTLRINPQTLAKLYVMPPQLPGGWEDQVLKTDIRYWLGFEKPFPAFPIGTSDKAFGTFGVGGSLAFADPDAGVGYAYVTNKLGFYTWSDPREKAVRDAFYKCLAGGAGRSA